MNFLLSQLKIFFTNRIGLFSVFANLFLAIWGLNEKGWNYSGFHFTYEPLPIKILTTINLPAVAIGESIGETLFPSSSLQFGFVENTGYEMILIVIFSIFQWLLFGYICKIIFQEKMK